MNNQVKMIRAEIERYVDSLERNSGMAGPFGDAQMALCDRLLSFIDSLPEEKVSDSTPLEESGEDLKSELHNYIEQHKSELSGYFDIRRVARHFANWQKQQMMKGTIDGYVTGNDERDIDVWIESERFRWIENKNVTELNIGDKVKLVIIKEE